VSSTFIGFGFDNMATHSQKTGLPGRIRGKPHELMRILRKFSGSKREGSRLINNFAVC
jgi:hypothetical protein